MKPPRIADLSHELRSKNDNKILDPSRVIDHEQSEYSIGTLVYLMEKTANAMEAAAKGETVDSSLSRLDSSKLSLLRSNMKELGPNFAINKDEYYNVFGKVANYASLSVLTGKRERSSESSLAVENGKLGMCIANDGTADIHASEFIDKINKGKPLTEAERNWAYGGRHYGAYPLALGKDTRIFRTGQRNLDADSPEARKSYNEYVLDKKQELVSLSNRMFETLKKQEYIAADPNDPESCIKNYELTSTYFSLVCDFVQVFSPVGDNNLNPSEPSAKKEVERTSAISNYQYFHLMPLQSYYTAYSKYMDFLSSDCMLDKDSDRSVLDMAARSKCFLENMQQSAKGKKTWGDIAGDRKLANNINSTSVMCCFDDSNFKYDPMNDINFAYLHSTDKNFNYITVDPSRAAFKRLGIETSNEDLCRTNQEDYEKAERGAAKYLPLGFTKNLDKAYTEMIEKEKEANKAPVREKMDIYELLGGSAKHVVKSVAPSEKQLDKEKSMGAMSAK